MYARLLAIVCLLGCSVQYGRAEALSPRSATVGVFLKADASASSLSLDAMRLELRDLMVPAGIDLTWTNGQNPSRAERLVVVTLRGDCQAGAKASGGFKDKTPLASTAVTDGKVLPFSWVDCNALNKFLKQSMSGRSASQRSEILGAPWLALLAHEFYHVSARERRRTPPPESRRRLFDDRFTGDVVCSLRPDAISQLRYRAGFALRFGLAPPTESRSVRPTLPEAAALAARPVGHLLLLPDALGRDSDSKRRTNGGMLFTRAGFGTGKSSRTREP